MKNQPRFPAIPRPVFRFFGFVEGGIIKVVLYIVSESNLEITVTLIFWSESHSVISNVDSSIVGVMG